MRFHNFITIANSRCRYFWRITDKTDKLLSKFRNYFVKLVQVKLAFYNWSNIHYPSVPMTILRGFWMSAPRQSRYHVTEPHPRKLFWLPTHRQGIWKQETWIYFFCPVLVFGTSMILSPKGTFSISSFFCRMKRLVFFQETNYDTCKSSGSREYRTCKSLVP